MKSTEVQTLSAYRSTRTSELRALYSRIEELAEYDTCQSMGGREPYML